jgi:hypothetical protein
MLPCLDFTEISIIFIILIILYITYHQVLVVRAKSIKIAVESSLNRELYGNFIKWKFVKQVRFVNKNIKMRTRNAENKEM